LLTFEKATDNASCGQFKVDFGLFYRIYAVKGKEISIFLEIETRKYVYL
jgi:hypothetical protein